MSGTRNKIEDLRNHLFETLEALRDPEKPMDLDRAKAVSEVSKVIIESAKVEVDFLRVTGAMAGSGFIPVDQAGLPKGASKEGPKALPAANRPLRSPREGLA